MTKILYTDISFPSEPNAGDWFYREDTGQQYVFDGERWMVPLTYSSLLAENTDLRERVAELEAALDKTIDWIYEHADHEDYCWENVNARECLCGRDEIFNTARALLKESEESER